MLGDDCCRLGLGNEIDVKLVDERSAQRMQQKSAKPLFTPHDRRYTTRVLEYTTTKHCQQQQQSTKRRRPHTNNTLMNETCNSAWPLEYGLSMCTPKNGANAPRESGSPFVLSLTSRCSHAIHHRTNYCRHRPEVLCPLVHSRDWRKLAAGEPPSAPPADLVASRPV